MVYVIKKMFYREGCIDNAFTIGIGDIICFSSWKKAEDYVIKQTIIDEGNGNPKYEIWNEDLQLSFCDDVAKKAKTYAQQQFDEQNYRVGYTIVQPKIW